MSKKKNRMNWAISLLKDFISDFKKKLEYEIIDTYECPKTRFTKAEIRLSSRQIIAKNRHFILVKDFKQEKF